MQERGPTGRFVARLRGLPRGAPIAAMGSLHRGERGSWGASLVVGLGLAGCTAEPPRPLELRPVPWQDGEQCIYDVHGADGALVESARYGFRAADEGWVMTRETLGKRARVELHLSPQGAPLSSHTLREGGDTAEIDFGPPSQGALMKLRRTTKGKTEEKTIQRPADAIDGREFYEALRLLPLAPGYRHDLTLVDASSLEARSMSVEVKGEETLTLPAGSYPSWHLVVDTHVSGTRHLWVGKEAPYPWLKYRWPGRSEILLRSEKRSEKDEMVGATEPLPHLPDSTGPRPRLNWALAAAQLLVQFPVTVAVPLLLGASLTRRWKLSFRVWAMGLLAFPASQVVHLPLNWLLGLGGSPGPLTGASVPVLGLALGLSAGLCEELSRYAFMRWGLREPSQRGWSRGVVFGVGHGGIESILFGGTASLGALNMLIASLFPFLIPAAQRRVLDATLEAYADIPYWASFYAAAERMAAMSAHVLMSVLVMRALTRGNLAYLLAAIAFHTALDAPIVFKATLGLHGLMAFILVMGAIALGGTFLLRERE